MSVFRAIEYHHDHLDTERSFLVLEGSNEAASELLDTLKSKFKFLKFELRFAILRCKPIVLALEIFESDFAIGCLTMLYIEQIAIELYSQKHFASSAISEVTDDMTETFSQSEMAELQQQVAKYSSLAEAKFLKYFGDSGCYPSLAFLKELIYFYPPKLTDFPEQPQFTHIDISNVPVNEFVAYRRLGGTFSSVFTAENMYEITFIEKEVLAIQSFWARHVLEMPNLAKIAHVYAFLPGGSSSVERTFSYYNKLLSDERRSLDVKYLEALLFLYFDAEKL